MVIGLTLGIASIGKLLVIDGTTLEIAIVVSITLFVTILIAKIIGCALPILVKKIGFDPAVVVSPFITTVVDAVCLIIYFQIASIFLHL